MEFYPELLKRINNQEPEIFEDSCRWGFGNLVKYLWKNRPPQDYPLCLAAQGGHLEVFQILLALGYVPTDRVLRHAINEGFLEIFILFTPDLLWIEDYLENASEKGWISIVQLILDNKARDNSSEIKQSLISASEYGHLEIVKLLIENGFDPTFDNNEALHKACSGGHSQVVEYLLDQGADLHSNEEFALCIALDYEHTDIVDLLIDRGARMDIALNRID